MFLPLPLMLVTVTTTQRANMANSTAVWSHHHQQSHWIPRHNSGWNTSQWESLLHWQRSTARCTKQYEIKHCLVKFKEKLPFPPLPRPVATYRNAILHTHCMQDSIQWQAVDYPRVRRGQEHRLATDILELRNGRGELVLGHSWPRHRAGITQPFAD